MTARRFPALLGALLLAALASVNTTGCANIGYYWQSASGQLQLMNAARPVGDWLADPQASDALKNRLALSQRIRSFASQQLALPDNPSYRRYADLHRKAAVWNVVAAPALSLTLKTWCFPITGCVGYRGYFSEADAKADADIQKSAGLEVSVYAVPAYSTLGWMNWAGGDPLLNTFINYPEGELARLIFHELSHQVVYASGDTTFNESFATAVERLGGQRWLASEAPESARLAYAVFNGRRQDFRALALATRQSLQAIYDSKQTSANVFITTDAIKLEAKEAAMQKFRADYAVLKAQWGGFAGYDAWVAKANNASFGAQAAYDELVPGFETLFDRSDHDWLRFYAAVKALAALPQDVRHAALTFPDTERKNNHDGQHSH